MPITPVADQAVALRYAPPHGWSAPLPPVDSPGTLVLAFGAPEYIDDPAALQELASRYPSSVIIGCSTAGEILGTEVSDGSLSVGIRQFRHTRLATAFAPVRGTSDSFHAGQSIATQLDGPGFRAVLVLADGLQTNGTELIRGLHSLLPEGVTVTGGLAGDGEHFRRTWVLKHGVPTTNIVVAVGFYGDRIRVAHGCCGGWDVFGPQRRVTRSRSNVLYELDGKPALPLYKEYLGELASGLPATALLYPLEMRPTPTDGEAVVRSVLAVDEAANSLIFGGDIPEGSYVRLMHANFDRLVEAAGQSASIAAETAPGDAARLIIAVSCVGRRIILGERTEEELEAVAERFAPGDALLGFYSYGELSPIASGRCTLHNQTMTITSIREV